MKKELQDQLYETYPKLFAQKDLPMTQTCMCWGIDTGDGWYNILNNACSLIQQRVDQPHEDIEMYEKWISDEEDQAKIERWKERIEKAKERIISVEFVQVKEKFGTLRLYHTSDDPYICGIVSMAEFMSSTTCEICGNKGKSNSKGWITTLCDPCRENRFKSE